MQVMAYMEDYQVVAKKQGTKSIPPVSSLILLFPPSQGLFGLFGNGLEGREGQNGHLAGRVGCSGFTCL